MWVGIHEFSSTSNTISKKYVNDVNWVANWIDASGFERCLQEYMKRDEVIVNGWYLNGLCFVYFCQLLWNEILS